ncbi:MAG: EscU/YscU/HrcU family type III secretion system export apparatus switch protein [Proteobacteria bacterium]|nr:EscU/YscU/HrcU family type III secretion system export apparatus switch protein [Pseudomonadota bacterium]
MADAQRNGEATEPPSTKRLRDARRRGEVARSGDAVAAVVLVAGGAALAWTGAGLVAGLAGGLRRALLQATDTGVAPAAALAGATYQAAGLVWPLLLVVVVGAIAANFGQVGALLALDPIVPKLERINPLRNAPRTLGRQAWVNGAKAAAKLGLAGYVALTALKQQLPGLTRLVWGRPDQVVSTVGSCALALTWRLAALALAFGLVDLVYQRWSYRRRLRMTKDEVRREHKEQEGDPQHKAERQRAHRELAEQRMFAAVAEADCVICNPEHIAVALRYVAETMEAPRVVARGRRAVAARIRAEARRHGVPIIRQVGLARALIELELDQEIPAPLYEAVGEVLRFVQGLAERRDPRPGGPGATPAVSGGGSDPVPR